MNRNTKFDLAVLEIMKAEKPTPQLKEMSRGKLKIAVDENIISIGNLLKERGYKIYFPTPGTPDPKVHKWLTENSYRIFITRNWNDFKGFPNKKYHTIEIKTREDDLTVARKIEKIFLDRMSLIVISPGQVTTIEHK